MTWIKKNFNILLSISLFVFTILVFGPIELYCTNTQEFWFPIETLVFMVLIMTIIGVGILVGIMLILKGVGRNIYGVFLFAMALAFYIQGNYANLNYGQLDGTAINWMEYPLYALVDTLGWILIIVGLIVLYNVKKNWFFKVQKFGSLYIIAIQVVTLAVLFFTTDVTKEKSEYYLSNRGLYEVSEDENIIIFVLDAYDDVYFKELYNANSDKYNDIFEDFVYFDNATVGGANTKVAMPAILTGVNYSGGIEYTEYISNEFNSDGLYTDLKKNNYDVGIYTGSMFIPDNSKNLVDNQESTGYKVSSYPKLTAKYLTLTLYKYMPHVLKQYFWFYGDEFNNFKEGTSYKAYKIDDAKFYSTLYKEKLTLDKERNVFRLIHLNGAHPPYVINELAQAVETEETSMILQAQGALFIVQEYIAQLKELDVYDDSTIIIMADHGRETANASHGILFVKRKNSSDKFSINSAPVSYFDLHETLFEQIGLDKGRTFFDYSEGEERYRYFYFQDLNVVYMQVIEYLIDGNINESSSLYATGNVYSEVLRKDEVYHYGTDLLFGSNNTAAYYVLEGLSAIDMKDYSWTDGKVCVFEFPLEYKTNKNLLVTLNTVSIYTKNGPQDVLVYANDTLCYKTTVNKAGEIKFVIPGELINDDCILNMRIELPNAVSPTELFGENQDARVLSLAMSGLRIDETEQESHYESIDLSKEQVISLTSDNDSVNKSLLFGFGKPGTDFTWTSETRAVFGCLVEEVPENDIRCTVDLITIYGEKQMVTVYSNDQIVYSMELVKGDKEISFIIPKDTLETGFLWLEFELPDAVSPKAIGAGEDLRELALAIKQISFEDSSLYVKDNIYSEVLDKDEVYYYGTDLLFGSNNTAAYYVLEGLSAIDMKNYSWTDGKVCVFKFPLEYKTNKNLLVTLNTVSVYTKNGPQDVLVYANNTLCHKTTVNKAGEIKFVIPGELINDDCILNMRIELPNAVSPTELFGENQDARVLSLAMSGLRIDETEQEFHYESIDLSKKQVISLTSDNDTINKSLLFGFGKPGIDFTWTSETRAVFGCLVGEVPENDIKCTVDLITIYGEKQMVTVYSNDQIVYSMELVKGDKEISFIIPKDMLETGFLWLEFELPDAVSPKAIGVGEDLRELALAIKQISFE